MKRNQKKEKKVERIPVFKPEIILFSWLLLLTALSTSISWTLVASMQLVMFVLVLLLFGTHALTLLLLDYAPDVICSILRDAQVGRCCFLLGVIGFFFF